MQSEVKDWTLSRAALDYIALVSLNRSNGWGDWGRLECNWHQTLKHNIYLRPIKSPKVKGQYPKATHIIQTATDGWSFNRHHNTQLSRGPKWHFPSFISLNIHLTFRILQQTRSCKNVHRMWVEMNCSTVSQGRDVTKGNKSKSSCSKTIDMMQHFAAGIKTQWWCFTLEI